MRNKLIGFPLIGKYFGSFPFNVNIYKVYHENQVDFLRRDTFRPVIENGKYFLTFQSSAEAIPVPEKGLEDKLNNFTAVKVGEGDYKFARLKFDEKSQVLWFTLLEDESAKFAYANVLEQNANRFDKPVSTWEKILPFVVIIIATAIGAGVTYALVTGQVGQFSAAVQGLTQAITQNTQAIGEFGKTAGNVARPPA